MQGYWAAKGFPSYPGLMDRAQQLAFQPAGLNVPSYVANGNHDGLVQGNQSANAAFEDIATGCFKATGSTRRRTRTSPPPDGPRPQPAAFTFRRDAGAARPASAGSPPRRS